jgi:hypothetical protein
MGAPFQKPTALMKKGERITTRQTNASRKQVRLNQNGNGKSTWQKAIKNTKIHKSKILKSKIPKYKKRTIENKNKKQIQQLKQLEISNCRNPKIKKTKIENTKITPDLFLFVLFVCQKSHSNAPGMLRP